MGTELFHSNCTFWFFLVWFLPVRYQSLGGDTLPLQRIFFKRWRVNPILEPAACRDPPALVAQGVHPPCCEGSGPAASSCYCPGLELEEKSSQLLESAIQPQGKI